MKLEKIMNNFHALKIGDIKIWFSYETPIAIKFYRGLFVRENMWGQTTGKHLNHIDPDKKDRLTNEEFEQLLKAHSLNKL